MVMVATNIYAFPGPRKTLAPRAPDAFKKCHSARKLLEKKRAREKFMHDKQAWNGRHTQTCMYNIDIHV